jgi:hypothetical protein
MILVQSYLPQLYEKYEGCVFVDFDKINIKVS